MSENTKLVRQKVAGMSLGGGRKENFFLCVLEYYPDSKRWFLASVNQVKEEPVDQDEVISHWISDNHLTDLIIDFPLSRPECDSCQIQCPGHTKCPVTKVTNIKQMMHSLLDHDQALFEKNPKKYEQDRNLINEIDFSKNELKKDSFIPMISKSFKRKLKKGFLPYWHRPIDFWVWKHYYDPLLNIFKICYDSFGNVSLMLVSRFQYLRKHLPADLSLYESNVYLCLLELYRSGIITKIQLLELNNFEMQVHARISIIKNIEKSLNVFIYDRDLDLIVRESRAFDSFILTLVGKKMVAKQLKSIPDWACPQDAKFVVPEFS